MTTAGIVLPANGWRARPYQQKLWRWLREGGKRAVAVWHRRAGKDEVCLHWTCVAAHKRVGNYWHMLPEAAQARKAIWEAVNPHTGRRRIDEAFPEEIRESTRDNDMLIRFKNGSSWQVVGSDNYNSLVGSAPVGIVFSEWALADPAAWAYLRPILAENGGWALFIYTSRGRNHGHTTFQMAEGDPTWFAQRLTVDDTRQLPPEVLAQEKREYAELYGVDQGEALFEQEYFCSFEAAILGSYYGREMSVAEKDKRLTRVPHQVGQQVHTAWDLGIGDSTSIWFCQLAGKEIHLIDYYESSGVGMDHYAAELQKRPYIYGEHLLPHDADSREKGTGLTITETLQSLGLRNLRVLPVERVEHGINAARLLIPRCWFDAEKCKRGIEALRQYRKEWDDERKVFHNKPLHDWTSHAADAFRYLALGNPRNASHAPIKYRPLPIA